MMRTISIRSLVLVSGLVLSAAGCSGGGSASSTVSPSVGVGASASAGVAVGAQQLCQIESGLQTIVSDIESGSISSKDELMSRLDSLRTQLDTLASEASSDNDSATATAAKQAASAVGSLEDQLQGVSFRDVQSVATTIGAAMSELMPSGCPALSPST
jgi:uncharacterized phage infection (PIP) family protein YhgE